METAINMDDVKKKLADISIKDDPGDLIKDFCKFLSTRLNNRLAPRGFAISCDLTLHEIMTGTTTDQSNQIPNSLVEQPSEIYLLLRMEFPDIAISVCPKDFADEVVKIFKEM